MTDDAFDRGWWSGRHDAAFFEHTRRRILLTLGAGVAWICFTLLYVAFWAPGYTLFQSVVVVLVSLLALGGVIAGAWISFGLRMAERGFD
jgi:peptidoglycan/LPS O-acetylase OafA/YrhL